MILAPFSDVVSDHVMLMYISCIMCVFGQSVCGGEKGENSVSLVINDI